MNVFLPTTKNGNIQLFLHTHPEMPMTELIDTCIGAFVASLKAHIITEQSSMIILSTYNVGPDTYANYFQVNGAEYKVEEISQQQLDDLKSVEKMAAFENVNLKALEVKDGCWEQTTKRCPNAVESIRVFGTELRPDNLTKIEIGKLGI